jgi:hypothetical protein
MRRAHFGIGKAERIEEVEIRWPSGKVEKIARSAINAINNIVEGQAKQ